MCFIMNVISHISMFSHCLSLDFFVTHSCVIVFKNRMIVSRTIKGSDAFPLISSRQDELMPQNNPNHPERITLQSAETFLAQQRLLTYWSHSALPAIYCFVHSCLHLQISLSCCLKTLWSHSFLSLLLVSTPSLHYAPIRDKWFPCCALKNQLIHVTLTQATPVWSDGHRWRTLIVGIRPRHVFFIFQSSFHFTSKIVTADLKNRSLLFFCTAIMLF